MLEQTKERRSGGTDGGKAQRRGAAVEQRILRRSAVDGGVIDVDGGRWRDRRRWWTVT